MPARLGWIVMESPAVLLFLWIYVQGSRALELVPLSLCVLWQVHYVHRTFIFPFRLRAAGRTMPVVVALMAFSFQLVNAWTNARWLSELGAYPPIAQAPPHYLVGVALFVLGLGINLHADTVLLRLRAPGETGYRIPQGGLYRYITCPNYFGELIEWGGFALASWSLSGLAFFLFTLANLVPRAVANHRWYREKFADYPPERRALVPGVL
ncbi:MAG: DUF1295 domain-containing protein [Deltaproteobacteria bacterium]|nr:DUF1295 domain-containing protein [Deltaproteobacteria bacterium]MCB9788972.1 DUF1295 domain-containing protein [Deltaproteobacteria bacterium]